MVKDIPDQEYSEGLDILYRLGAGVNLGNLLPQIQGVILAAEFSDNHIHAGAEYTFRDIIAVRVGARTGNALTRTITAGFGLKLADFRLDYAYVSSEIGAQTSQFSLSVDW